MSIPFYSTAALLSGSLSMVIALAMLFLILWQSSRRLENWIMGGYMVLTFLWGSSVVATHLAPIFGYEVTLPFLFNVVFISLSGPLVFILTYTYYGLWQKRPALRAIYFATAIVVIALIPGLFQGNYVTGFELGPNGESIYQIQPWGYAAFAPVYFLHVASLAIIFKNRKQAFNALQIGVIVLSVCLISVLFSNGLANYPIGITAASISAILFTTTIMKDKLFNPLAKLNQDLAEANERLSELSQDLQTKESNLRAVLANTSDLIWSVDQSHRILTINSTAVDLFSVIYHRDVGVGDNFLDIIPQETRRQWEAWYARALNGERFTTEQHFQLLDSSYGANLEFSFNPIYDARGAVTAASLFARDITEKRRVQDRLRRQALTFENLYDSVIITDLNNYIIDCNPATERIFGYTRQEMLGRMPEMWQAPEETPTLGHEIMSGIKRNGRWSGEIRFIKKNGQRGICEAIALPLLDENGKRIATLSVSRDATQRKQFEAELQEAKEAAESANRAKSAFLASMSHELRTPLNAIIGYGEMLTEESEKMNYPELTSDLNRITLAGRHLLSLINDILDLSKIEAGKMMLNIERFDLRSVINDVIVTNESIVAQNNNRLEIDVAADVGQMQSDPVKLRQIIINLLSNAAKFTQDGQIVIKAEQRSINDENSIIIQVSDTGIGMNLEETQRIFSAFTQADASTTRRYGGTGLGLTITSRFCQLLGGSITVESEPDKGTVFTVCLPQSINQAVDSFEPLMQDDHPSDTTVQRQVPNRGILLIIDPNANDRNQFVRWLYAEGFRVYGAQTAAAGLKLAKKLIPNLLVIDNALTDMPSEELIRLIAQDPSLSDLPIVVSSTSLPTERELIDHVSTFITKPFQRDSLIPVIKDLTIQTKRKETDEDERRALVVEDNAALRDIMSLALKQQNIKVIEAADSLMALKLLNEGQVIPDIIILDLMLPMLDGFEFIERIHKIPLVKEVPILVVTAKQLTEHEHRVLEDTAVEILHKGFYTQTELLRRVNTVINAKVPLQN